MHRRSWPCVVSCYWVVCYQQKPAFFSLCCAHSGKHKDSHDDDDDRLLLWCLFCSRTQPWKYSAFSLLRCALYSTAVPIGTDLKTMILHEWLMVFSMTRSQGKPSLRWVHRWHLFVPERTIGKKMVVNKGRWFMVGWRDALLFKPFSWLDALCSNWYWFRCDTMTRLV